MRKILLILYIVLYFGFLKAQDLDEKVKNLSAPTSPAASILEMQPSTVLTPKTYQALETALYSNFLSENGEVLIPNNFALEFTPFWRGDTILAFEDFLYPKGLKDQIQRSSSFSVASTQDFLLGDSTKTNSMAIGYRTTLSFGNKNDRDEITEYRTKLKANQRVMAKILSIAEGLVNKGVNSKSDFIDKMEPVILNAIKDYHYEISDKEAIEHTKKIVDDINSLFELDKNNPDPFLDAVINILETDFNMADVFDNFKNYLEERQGGSIDVAGAMFLNFPSNDLEFSYVPRISFWATPTYRFKDNWSFLKAMFVVRYDWYNTDFYKKYFPSAEVFENNLNYGLAIAGEFKKFSIQFEYVRRDSNTEVPTGTIVNGNESYTKESSSDIQYLGSLSYRLNKQIALTYNLGNQFEPILNSESTLISSITLNYGIGGPTVKELNK